MQGSSHVWVVSCVCRVREKERPLFSFVSSACSACELCALLCCAPPNQAAILLSFVSKIRSIWVVVCERLWGTLALESLLSLLY